MIKVDRKVRHATIAGAITTLTIGILEQCDVQVSSELAAGITAIATALVGYLVKPSVQDSSDYVETLP